MRRKAIMRKYADKRAGKDYKCYCLGQKVLVLLRNPGKMESKWERDFYTVCTASQIMFSDKPDILQTHLPCEAILSAWLIHEQSHSQIISDTGMLMFVRKCLYSDIYVLFQLQLNYHILDLMNSLPCFKWFVY